MKDHDELTDLAEMPFERGNAGKLVNQIRMLAKEERAKQKAATGIHSINMHGYAANRLEAVLLAFGVSNDWPNGDLAAPAVNANTEKPSTPDSLGEAHGPAYWEYICVEVTRSESTDLYLKVPKGWRPSRRDRKMMGRAAKETTSDSDWNSYGWENAVEVQGHKPVDAKEAEQYKVFDALPLLPNAGFSDAGGKGGS